MAATVKRVPSFSARPGFPSGLRVLLVEVNADERESAVAMLEQCSYTVTACSSAVDALARLSAAPADAPAFDVMLADKELLPAGASASASSGGAPGEGEGGCLLAAMKLLPCILMGPSPSREDVLAGINLGAVDFLDKPLSVLKLRNIWQHTVRKMMRDMDINCNCNTNCTPSCGTPSQVALAASKPAGNGKPPVSPGSPSISELAAAAGLTPLKPPLCGKRSNVHAVASTRSLNSSASSRSCLTLAALAPSDSLSGDLTGLVGSPLDGETGDAETDSCIAIAAAGAAAAAAAAANAGSCPSTMASGKPIRRAVRHNSVSSAGAVGPAASPLDAGATPAHTPLPTAQLPAPPMPAGMTAVPLPAGLVPLPAGMVWGMPMNPLARAPGIVPPLAAPPVAAAPWGMPAMFPGGCMPPPPMGAFMPPFMPPAACMPPMVPGFPAAPAAAGAAAANPGGAAASGAAAAAAPADAVALEPPPLDAFMLGVGAVAEDDMEPLGLDLGAEMEQLLSGPDADEAFAAAAGDCAPALSPVGAAACCPAPPPRCSADFSSCSTASGFDFRPVAPPSGFAAPGAQAGAPLAHAFPGSCSSLMSSGSGIPTTLCQDELPEELQELHELEQLASQRRLSVDYASPHQAAAEQACKAATQQQQQQQAVRVAQANFLQAAFACAPVKLQQAPAAKACFSSSPESSEATVTAARTPAGLPRIDSTSDMLADLDSLLAGTAGDVAMADQAASGARAAPGKAQPSVEATLQELLGGVSGDDDEDALFSTSELDCFAGLGGLKRDSSLADLLRAGLS